MINVITIDGPAGSGKSTVARKLASTLGWAYLDSGALYRGIGWVLSCQGVAPISGPALDQALHHLQTHIERRDGRWILLINGEDHEHFLRSQEAAEAASVYSALQEVRSYLLHYQRDAGEIGELVCDGRDMGSVVFPDARFKFYLDASPEVRAKRRVEELNALGKPADYQAVLKEIRERDARDRTRTHAPLRVPQGAIIMDTSNKEVTEVLKKVLNIIDKDAFSPL